MVKVTINGVKVEGKLEDVTKLVVEIMSTSENDDWTVTMPHGSTGTWSPPYEVLCGTV